MELDAGREGPGEASEDSESHSLIQPVPESGVRNPAETNAWDQHQRHSDHEDGESGGEEDEVPDEAPRQPEEGQLPVDKLKLRVGPGHQVPALQLLRNKPLGHLVLDDAGHPRLHIVQHISAIK